MTDGDHSPGSRHDPGRPVPSPGQRRPGGHRVPAPMAAQRRLMAQIAAGRRARQQRTLLAILAAMSSLVLVTSGGAWMLTSYVTSHVHRLNAGTSGTPSSGPLNILVAGVDIRAGLTRRQQARLHVGHAVSDNSDTLMLAHVPANHSYVQVVSLPRDSWVNIPGHGMNKINAAFGLGGPRLMVRTVEANTGLTINDYIEVNFLGFVKVIDAMGGVNICLPYAVDDPYSGLHMAAGAHHVDGITALEFARDRHSFATSDLARIGDQQQLLATLLNQAVSAGTLSDPFRLRRVLDTVTAALRVDQGFNVVGLASELRGIRPGDVSFTTVPLSSYNYQTPTGESAVLWSKTQAGQLFAQIRNDQPPAGAARKARTGHRGRPRRQAGHHRRRRHGPPSGTASPGQGSSPGQARTAAQDACR
jgi:LCP family protein required for cell wall assembly